MVHMFCVGRQNSEVKQTLFFFFKVYLEIKVSVTQMKGILQ